MESRRERRLERDELTMRPAVFLDRDGTLNQQAPRGEHNTRPEDLKLLPGVADSLRRLAGAGYALVVVSNQSGVEAGAFSRETVEAVNSGLVDLLAAEGVGLDGVYFCPHKRDSTCNCRKPKPGMLLRAAEELGLDLSQSWMIGDAARDLEAGKAAGCRVILAYAQSYPGEREAAEAVGPHASCPDLRAAADAVLDSGNP